MNELNESHSPLNQLPPWIFIFFHYRHCFHVCSLLLQTIKFFFCNVSYICISSSHCIFMSVTLVQAPITLCQDNSHCSPSGLFGSNLFSLQAFPSQYSCPNSFLNVCLFLVLINLKKNFRTILGLQKVSKIVSFPPSLMLTFYITMALLSK